MHRAAAATRCLVEPPLQLNVRLTHRHLRHAAERLGLEASRAYAGVAETPYITAIGFTSDQLLTLYKKCRGERADADDLFKKCSGSAAESPKDTPLPPPPPTFPLLTEQAMPTSSKQIPTPTTTSAVSPPQAPNKNQDPWYKDVVLRAVYCLTGLVALVVCTVALCWCIKQGGSALDIASDILKKLLKIFDKAAGQDESHSQRRQPAQDRHGGNGSARVNPVDAT